MPRGIYIRTKSVKLSAEHKQRISDSLKGRVVSIETRKKIGLSNKGNIPFNKGICHSEETKLKMSQNRSTGKELGYRGLHHWVVKNLGKPSNCEHCHNTELNHRQYHWANKSHEYKKDLSDWLRLCVSCHSKYDSVKGVI